MNIQIIANSKKKYSELTSILDKEKTGIFVRSLNSLQDLEIFSKYYTINKLNGEFDVAIQNKNGFEIYEIKYLKGK